MSIFDKIFGPVLIEAAQRRAEAYRVTAIYSDIRRQLEKEYQGKDPSDIIGLAAFVITEVTLAEEKGAKVSGTLIDIIGDAGFVVKPDDH